MNKPGKAKRPGSALTDRVGVGGGGTEPAGIEAWSGWEAWPGMSFGRSVLDCCAGGITLAAIGPGRASELMPAVSPTLLSAADDIGALTGLGRGLDLLI